MPAATEFGRIVVNGTFTFALMVGLSVGDTTLGTLVANLGYDKVRMPKPVFIGDTLRAETDRLRPRHRVHRRVVDRIDGECKVCPPMMPARCRRPPRSRTTPQVVSPPSCV